MRQRSARSRTMERISRMIMRQARLYCACSLGDRPTTRSMAKVASEQGR